MARFDPKSILNAVRGAALFGRPVRVLAGHLADAIPNRGSVLEVGTGDGLVAAALMKIRPDLKVEGVDTVPRPDCRIPVAHYDGMTLPFADRSFDYVGLVDVLRHTESPAGLLGEAARVARQGIVLKDSLAEGLFAAPTLRFMDWAGNGRHSADVPRRYLTRDQWQGVYYRAGLATVSNAERLGLYPQPLSWIFDRNLHFVALLVPRNSLR